MFNITFQQIEAFITVGRYLNMSRAAESLYISQPTLSKALQRFEAGVGYPVFTRSNQGVVLTPQGEYLLTAMEALYKNMEKAIHTAKTMVPASNKFLRIVAPSSYDAAEDYNTLKFHVREYMRRYPEVTLVEQLCDFRELQRQFEFGETDLAFTHNFALPVSENVTSKIISNYHMHIAMSAEHPLAAHDTVPPELLAELTFYAVGQLDEDESKAAIVRRCKKLGFEPRRVELLDNFPTLLHMLREKRGASICGRFALAGANSDIKYYPLKIEDTNSYVVVAWHPDRLTKQAKDFLHLLT